MKIEISVQSLTISKEIINQLLILPSSYFDLVKQKPYETILGFVNFETKIAIIKINEIYFKFPIRKWIKEGTCGIKAKGVRTIYFTTEKDRDEYFQFSSLIEEIALKNQLFV